MLSPADAALADRDVRLPALAVLLDDAALAGWLGRFLDVGTVHRRYLRYKAGTSCVLAADIDGRTVVVTCHAPGDAAVKIAKIERRAPRGAVLALDRSAAIVATTPAGDRHLPALGGLTDVPVAPQLVRGLLRTGAGRERSDLSGLTIDQISYKPNRRWVGIARADDADPFVVRAYRRGTIGGCVSAMTAAGRGAAPTPAVLGSDRRLAVVAVEYLPGRTLTTGAPLMDLSAAGAAVARLHDHLPAGTSTHDSANNALRSAALSLEVLLPDLAGDIRAAVHEITRALRRADGPIVRIHGDFSLDQVVIDGAGTGRLIDLDRSGPGQAADDLGCAAAAAAAAVAGGDSRATGDRLIEHAVSATVDGLAAGYAQQRRLPAADAVRAHTAAHLLRRAVEPFRLCRAEWAMQAEALLLAARRQIAAPDSARHRWVS
jgi:hypothetical protein